MESSRFFTSPTNPSWKHLAARFAAAHFVKAFNSVGAPFHGQSAIQGRQAHHVHLRQQRPAKKQVTAILDQFGWETADMGKAEAARAIEPLCMLWCIPGFTPQPVDPRLQTADRLIQQQSTRASLHPPASLNLPPQQRRPHRKSRAHRGQQHQVALLQLPSSIAVSMASGIVPPTYSHTSQY
jgi:hypothetical protein